MTDKDNPVQLSRTPYDQSRYTHQGWLTEDGKHFLVDDELDETDNPDVTKTQTYVFNVEDLDQDIQQLVNTHEGETTSIDHNQYILDGLSYQSNYRSGLRVLDVSNPADLNEVGLLRRLPEGRPARVQRDLEQLPVLRVGQHHRQRHRAGPVRAPAKRHGSGRRRPGGGDTGSGRRAAPAGTGSTGGSSNGSSGDAKGAIKSSRLRAGFGRHRYGRVRGAQLRRPVPPARRHRRQVCAATAKVGKRTVGQRPRRRSRAAGAWAPSGCG